MQGRWSDKHRIYGLVRSLLRMGPADIQSEGVHRGLEGSGMEEASKRGVGMPEVHVQEVDYRARVFKFAWMTTLSMQERCVASKATTAQVVGLLTVMADSWNLGIKACDGNIEEWEAAVVRVLEAS
jgi:hypothetical protein